MRGIRVMRGIRINVRNSRYAKNSHKCEESEHIGISIVYVGTYSKNIIVCTPI